MITLECSCGARETAEIEFTVRPAVRRTQILRLVEQRDAKTGDVLLVPTHHGVREAFESVTDAAARADMLTAAEYAGRIAAFEAAHAGPRHRPTWTAGFVPEPEDGTPEPVESTDGPDTPEAI